MSRSMPRRVASLVIFCVVALLLTLVAQAVWTGLLVVNLKSSPGVPWAVVVMAAIVWAIWRYFGGVWPPASTSNARHHYRRTNPMSVRVLAWGLVAGLLGLSGLVAFWLVLGLLVGVPGNPSANYAGYSPLTVVAVVVMASVVGAVTEELGVRGYMLTRLEESVGGALAVVIVAIVIAPGHAATQGFAISTTSWYFLSDLLLGALAVLTGSIVPGMIVHGVGLLAFFSLIWPTDHLRHSAPIGSQGAQFWIYAVVSVGLVFLCVLALHKLASIRPTPQPAMQS